MWTEIDLLKTTTSSAKILAQNTDQLHNLLMTYKTLILELYKRRLINIDGSYVFQIKQGSLEWKYRNNTNAEIFLNDIRELMSMELICVFIEEQARTIHSKPITQFAWKYQEDRPFEWILQVSLPSDLLDFIGDQTARNANWITTDLFPDITPPSKQPPSRPVWAEQLIIHPVVYHPRQDERS